MKFARTPLLFLFETDERLRRSERAASRGNPEEIGRLIREQMRAKGSSSIMRDRIANFHAANARHAKIAQGRQKGDLGTAFKQKVDALSAVHEGAKHSGTTIAQHHKFERDSNEDVSWSDLSDHFHETASLYGAETRGDVTQTRPGVHPHSVHKPDWKPGKMRTRAFPNQEAAEKFRREYGSEMGHHFHEGHVQQRGPRMAQTHHAQFLTKTSDPHHYDV
jgi:hypothetical protein